MRNINAYIVLRLLPTATVAADSGVPLSPPMSPSNLDPDPPPPVRLHSDDPPCDPANGRDASVFAAP